MDSHSLGFKHTVIRKDKCQSEFLFYLMADEKKYRPCMAYINKKRVKGHPGPTEGSFSIFLLL
jgi:hypothetical protein